MSNHEPIFPDGVVLVSKSPEDPAERRQWATAMTHVQIAMWIDGEFACAQCGKVFASVDDFLARDPRYVGPEGVPFRAVDDACWPAWETPRP